MKKLPSLFGFECVLDDEGLVSVEINFNYPQESFDSRRFYENLEANKIHESNITFPLRLSHWTVTINPTDKLTIMEYFRISGLKKIVDENKSKLIGKTTFIKPEVKYEKKCKYPNLNIHFYEVVNEGGDEVINIFEMIEYCKIHLLCPSHLYMDLPSIQ